MKRLSTLVLMLCLVLSGAWSYAHSVAGMENEKDGDIPIELINGASQNISEKTDYIIASINGHVLSVVFTQNFGQVVVEVTTAEGGEVDVDSIQTPNGVNFYIPNSGSYVVTFTFPAGDVYYGEFEVTE